jgi:hypothetical protein
MHLVESLATSCGLKIDKPYIYEKYYPLNFDKYIIIETHDSKNPAKNYDYWQEVVNILLPILNKHDIKILQLCGQNDQKILNSYTVTGEIFGQRAFLIKNSLAYVGSNNFSIQVASYFNNRIVAMYSNHYASQFNPYWSDKSRTTILEILENDKPSFSNTENPKVINNLMPDQIAQSIFDKLAIKVQTGLKFSHIGQNYISKTIEIVPNLIVDPASLGAPHIIVRMDIEFNEQILEAQLKTSKALIVTNKEISEDLVKKYKQNIVQIFYKIEENNSPNFVKLLKSQNINYILASYLKEDEINKIKINYMDLGLILKLSYKTKDQFNKQAKYYKSNKFILSNNKLYISEAALEKDLPVKDFNQNIQQIIDTDTFWNYSDNYAFLVD